MVQTDEALLLAWRQGDSVAGRTLLERYFEILYRFFSNKVHDGLDDLIQDTLIECVKSVDRFRGASSFRTYLLGIARHRLSRFYRGRDRAARFIPAGVESVAGSTVSPSMKVLEAQRRHLLLRALRELPLDFQIALELFYWEELTAAEIAEILELPEGTVRSRIRRGRELLQGYLDELLREQPQPHRATTDDIDAWARAVREHALPKPSPV